MEQLLDFTNENGNMEHMQTVGWKEKKISRKVERISEVFKKILKKNQSKNKMKNVK